MSLTITNTQLLRERADNLIRNEERKEANMRRMRHCERLISRLGAATSRLHSTKQLQVWVRGIGKIERITGVNLSVNS